MGGRMEDAERAFAELIVEGRATAELDPVMSNGFTLGRVQRARGRLGAALRTYQDGLRFATEGGRRTAYQAGEPHVGIAEVLYERDELDLALEHVTQGIELCRQVLVLRKWDRGLCTLGWIRQAMGEADAALDAMDEACRIYPTVEVASLFNPAPAERARLLLAQGRIDQAARWTEERGSRTTTRSPTRGSATTSCSPGSSSPAPSRLGPSGFSIASTPSPSSRAAPEA
jgi:LuxR family maltose regulon positive regulatory protein